MSKDKKCEVRLEFPDLTKEQSKHLFLAEGELEKAGITFDTGYSLGDNCRDWELDWSLKGAEVKFVKFTEGEEK